MIVVLWSDAKSDRYALHRFADGAVAWRGDAFTAPEDPAEPERWIAYRGELTVAEVIERVPDAAVSVLTWTRAEIESGVEAAHLDAPRARERRAESLDRLGRELESVTG